MYYKLSTIITGMFTEDTAKAYAMSPKVGWRETIDIPVDITEENPTGIESTPNPKTWQEALEEHFDATTRNTITKPLKEFAVARAARQIEAEVDVAITVQISSEVIKP